MQKSVSHQYRQHIKAIGQLVCICFMLMAGAFNDPSKALADGLPNIPYILVDTSDNAVLAKNRMHERWHPASLTKLMTAYVTFRAIASGDISLGSPVSVTALATKTPPSKMGYKAGSQLRFDTALRILLVKSANDVAIAVAESVAGSVPAFVNMMNAEADRLGLKDTHYSNPNGLHDANQYTSARDMVILSSAIWNEFPQYRELFETPSITDGKKIHYSYNLLLERFAGTTGMKTGFVCASGYNMVASAERGGRRLVAVVFGADSQTERAETSARLLLDGFSKSTGEVMASFQRPEVPVGPSNVRKEMCSESAIKKRYDPAPETAVIKSAFLEDRQVTKQPVLVGLGNIDGEPSSAWLAREFTPSKVPVPTKRPEYAVVDVNGDVAASTSLRGTIPIPSKRPAAQSAVQ